MGGNDGAARGSSRQERRRDEREAEKKPKAPPARRPAAVIAGPAAVIAGLVGLAAVLAVTCRRRARKRERKTRDSEPPQPTADDSPTRAARDTSPTPAAPRGGTSRAAAATAHEPEIMPAPADVAVDTTQMLLLIPRQQTTLVRLRPRTLRRPRARRREPAGGTTRDDCISRSLSKPTHPPTLGAV